MSTEEDYSNNYAKSPYFHVAHARDLTGKDRLLFRLLEILPGALSWGTILIIVILSAYKPVWAAYFIIAFDLYWLLKTVNLSFYQRHNWKRLKHNIKVDWKEMISEVKYEHVYHMVNLPYYNESEQVVEETIKSVVNTDYNTKKMIIVLGAEERAGEEAYQIGLRMKEKYGSQFKAFVVTKHPKDLPGESPGKGSNTSWMAEQVCLEILDPEGINYEDVLVSNFDIDTVVWPQYFLCLTWYFLTTEDRFSASFQPVPLYNNNIWEAPAFSRVAAMSSTFWQMIQQERPEKLTTFSSHSVSFKSLYEIDYWQKNMVSEDSRIFWNLYMASNGNYRVVPIAYPVSMDANLDKSFWRTARNVYKQHRRWMWGVENIPYIIFNFIKNKKIPLKKKIKHSLIQIEGFWSLATNPLVIFLLGWLPLVLGGDAFRDTVLSYNLPLITRNLMSIAMAGLIVSAIIAASLAPPIPVGMKNPKRRWTIMILQWILIPITIIIFGAIPGLEAQTRLMFGRYMGFWVTPKHRGQKVLGDTKPNLNN